MFLNEHCKHVIGNMDRVIFYYGVLMELAEQFNTQYWIIEII